MLSSHWPKLLMLIALGMSILLPVVIGLGEALRAAFGILPALGRHSFSVNAWQQLWQLPGLISSLRLTLFSGFAATIMALLLAIFGSSWVYNSSLKLSFLGRLKPLVQLIIVLHSAAYHYTVQHIAVQCTKVHHHALQCCTPQHSTEEYSIIGGSTV